MNRPRRILLITILESFASICLQRGAYFFSKERLGFTGLENLLMALCFGVAYVLGAFFCHRISNRLKEKNLLLICLIGQVAAHALLGVFIGPVALVVGASVVSFIGGLKWPLIESYVGAGHTPIARRAIGRFNIAWAATIPAAMLCVGPIIAWWSRGLFFLSGLLNLGSLLVVRPLPARPVHLSADHPERPTAGQLVHYKALLNASRWLMLISYAMLWVLAPLLPDIFRRLNYGVKTATGLSGLLDLSRLGMFGLYFCWVGWHNRLHPIVGSLVAMPVGFFMVLFGQSPAVVLLGEVVFGLGAGVVYFAALYYAMVVENASVGAGGGHETLIGLAFVIGPLAGLAGTQLAPVLGSDLLGYLVGVGPPMVICFAGTLWSLRKVRWRRLAGAAGPPAPPA